MAALDFPSSPTNGQAFVSGATTWTYNSTKGVWNITSNGPIGYTGSAGVGYTGSAGYVGSSGISPAQLKTSAYTATAGDVLACNTFTAAFSITLPASPSAGNLPITIFDAGSNNTFNGFATNNLTVLRNGSTIHQIADDVVITTKGASIRFEYVSGTWRMRNGG